MMPSRGLAEYCICEANLAAEGLVGPAQVQWLNRVHDDLANYRDALTWLIERGRPADASQIASGLMFFWLIREHAAEGLRWYERILNMPFLSPAAEVRALIGAAVMSYAQGEHRRARTGATRAVALAHDLGELEMFAHAENLLGYVEYAVGNLDAARDHADRMLDDACDRGWRASAPLKFPGREILEARTHPSDTQTPRDRRRREQTRPAARCRFLSWARSVVQPPCRRRTAHQLLKGAAERRLRFVADGAGDPRH